MRRLLPGLVRLERGGVVLRLERLTLSARERVRADGAARALWPGLVPMPLRACLRRRLAGK